MTSTQALRCLRSREFLVACVDQGMTQRQIAAALGVNRTSVREHMAKRNVRPVALPNVSEERRLPGQPTEAPDGGTRPRPDH